MFSQATLIAIASLIASANADNLVGALISDINGNLPEYASLVATDSAELAPFLSLYGNVQTYTDDSYTTLLDSQMLASISQVATALPWYSSRIAPALTGEAAASATGSAAASGSADASAAASSGAASAPVSSGAASSAASEVSSGASSAAKSSGASSAAKSSAASSSKASSSEGSSSKDSSSSSSASATSSAAAAIVVPQPGSASYALAAGLVGLISGVALL